MTKIIKISKRGELAPDSPIRKLTRFAEEAKKEGIKIYHLNIGQPDLKVPSRIRTEIRKVSNIDYLPYTNSQGTKETLLSYSKYFHDIKVNYSPKEILITFGASEALIFAIAAICDPEDEIIAFEPFYANYLGFANLVSAKIIPVQLDAQENFHLPSQNKIVGKITDRTKAILFTNPNNPTGTVFRKYELQTILDIAKKYRLFIISDETYHGVSFKTKAISFMHLAKDLEQQQIIIIDSLSKRYNVCGARIGAIASKNLEIMSAVNRFAQERLSVGFIDQKIVTLELQNSLGDVKKITKIYQARRDAFLKTLEGELNIKTLYPEGAFYAMIKLPIKDSDEFAKWLLTNFRYKNETVMVAPGSGFYASPGKGKDEIRIAYVLGEEELKKAAKLLAIAVKQYNNSQHLRESK